MAAAAGRKKRTTSLSLFMEAYGLEVEEELSTVDEVESRKKLEEQKKEASEGAASN